MRSEKLNALLALFCFTWSTLTAQVRTIENVQSVRQPSSKPAFEHQPLLQEAAVRPLTAKTPANRRASGHSTFESTRFLWETIGNEPSMETSAPARFRNSPLADRAPVRAVQNLTPGATLPITFPAVDSSTFFRGDYGIKVTVPAGATSLEIKLQTSTAKADVDLYVRYGQEPALQNGSPVADYTSSGPDGNETIRINSASSPVLRAGDYYIAFGVFTLRTEIQSSVTATIVSDSNSTPPPSTSSLLQPGVTTKFTLPAVQRPTLASGDYGYRINVPDGATRMIVKLETLTPGADLDLYVRRGLDIEVADGKPLADYGSEGDTGNETITIDEKSTPPLRSGMHYIGFGIFTPGIDINAQITVTLEGAKDNDPKPPQPSPIINPLESGKSVTFKLPSVDASTLFVGDYGYAIVVPENAEKLEVKITSSTPGAEVDLYLRYNADVDLVDGKTVADYFSRTESASETILVTKDSKPPLKAGVYFIAFGVFTTGKPIEITVTATVTRGAVPPLPRELTSGTPAAFSLPAVTTPTVFTGDYSFRIVVPEGARRLEIKLNTATPGVDVDLYARFGADVDLQNGRLIADFASESLTGAETIVISTSTTPSLKAGTYWISLGCFTSGKAATGTVTAVIALP